MSSLKARLALAAMLVTGGTAWASNASAQVACDSLTNPVYVTGSSAVQPFMEALGTALYASGTTIVYQRAGSCNGVTAIVKDETISGVAKYYPGPDANNLPVPTDCNLPVGDAGSGGTPVDLGVSDVFAESCPGGARDPAKVGDFLGPNQVMTFVTPIAALQSVNISAEAAYFVMGLPTTGKTVAPWTNYAKLFIRDQTSGTQTMIGKAIGLDASAWKGTNATSAAGVESAIKSANESDPMPQGALGIVSTGEADRDRSFLKVLGFQPMGQKCAYWPDSKLTTFDKKWVRTGEYQIWGPLHMLAKVPSAGAPPNHPGVAKIVGYFDGSAVPPGGKTQILDLEIANHTVPQCAMKVKRTTELGAYTSYTDPNPCGCYFDLKTSGVAPTTCKTCADTSECGAGNVICSYGYCESK